MIQYPFTAYPLIAVVSLMFVLPATVYLLRLRVKTSATYNLIGFLLCSAVSLIGMFVYNAIFYSFTPLWAVQDAALIVGAVFLARFAYSFPQEDRSAEARRVVGFFVTLAFFVVGWVLVDSWRYAQNPYGFRIDDSFWFLMPATIPLMTAVFLRRMLVLADLPPKSDADGQSRARPLLALWTGVKHFWQVLRHPPNRDALAHRAFAVAILSALVQATGSIFYFLLIPGEAWIAVGTLLTLSLLLLAYLNATASANSLIVRMVGATLIVFLAVTGAVGSQAILTAQHAYWHAHLRMENVLFQALEGGAVIDYPETLVYVATYPAADSLAADQIAFQYVNPDIAYFSAERMRRVIQQAGIPEPYKLSDQPKLIRIDQEPVGRTPRFLGSVYPQGENVLELGFVYFGRNAESHVLVNRLIRLIVQGTAFILLFLPLFFRSSLIVPLQNLLQGVQRVNAGDLKVSVPVRIEDEIGFLTRSFNGMTNSLHELTEGLEQRVQERTHSLRAEIAERRRVQTELEIATRRAEEANRAKSIFLANMSHELRTPLNAILGYAQMLQSQVPDADRPASIIGRSGRHLLSLINGVLDLARIEAGKTELTPEPVALADFLRRVSDLASIQAQAKGLTFRVETEVGPNTAILADRTRLRQILLNLLSNAVSYTDAGEVVMRTVQEPVSFAVGAGRFHFSVSDSGLGIAAEDQPLLFQPMYQTERARQRRSGSGLGLSISDQLVRLMGGQIRVESQLDRGSTFSFSLELPLCDPPPGTASFPQRKLACDPAPRILVIDDNVDNRELLVDVLRPIGFEVMGMNAQQGVQIALADPFDLIITDLLMPDLNGFEVIRLLRAHTATASTPIIAASASVYPQDKARSVEAGADAFVDKPISFPLLLGLFDQLLDLQWQPEPAATAPPAGPDADALPPAQTIQDLAHFAQAGDIVALQQMARQMDAQMTGSAFVIRLNRLVSSLQLDEISAWLETLPHQPEALTL